MNLREINGILMPNSYRIAIFIPQIFVLPNTVDVREFASARSLGIAGSALAVQKCARVDSNQQYFKKAR